MSNHAKNEDTSNFKETQTSKFIVSYCTINVPNASGNAASRPGWYTETCVDITALVWTAARGHRKPPVTDLQLA